MRIDNHLPLIAMNGNSPQRTCKRPRKSFWDGGRPIKEWPESSVGPKKGDVLDFSWFFNGILCCFWGLNYSKWVINDS